QFHRGSSPLCPQLFADSNGDGLAGARRSDGFALVDAVRTGDSGRLALAPALLCPQVAFESDRDVLGRRLAARGKKRRALVPLGRACCNEFHSSSSSTVSSCCRPPIMSGPIQRRLAGRWRLPIILVLLSLIGFGVYSAGRSLWAEYHLHA